MTDLGWDRQPEPRSGTPDALTPIHRRIHFPATQRGETLSETDRIQLNHFFDVLADVVLSVAKRRLTGDQVTKTCEP